MNGNSANGQFGQRSMPIIPKTASEALRPEQGTPPPKRSRQSRNRLVVFLNFLVTMVVVGLVGSGLAFYFGQKAFEAEGPADVAGLFMVRPSTGVSEIATQLERQGFISDARVFQVGVRAYGTAGELKAGEYEIKARASMHEIMDLLHSGKSVLYSLTIPEGITVEQALDRIRNHEVLTGDLPADLPIEGSFVADTMRFQRGTTRSQVVAKLVADQKKLVESIWERRVDDLPVATIDEFVTLASIVEKETGKGDERSRVAGVFVNRLKKGMRLQSDPTIIYGLFGGKGKPEGRPIYQSDIEKPTPYNTYVINGLPPTPIANPGRAALEAVANPSRTNDLYFVADGTGGHAFAETLDEHNQNVAEYRKIEKQMAEDAAKAAAAAETTGGTEADTAAD
jgi:UPF0755 protein